MTSKEASINLNTELVTVAAAPASANIAVSSLPEDIFSFGNDMPQSHAHNEFSRYLTCISSLVTTPRSGASTNKRVVFSFTTLQQYSSSLKCLPRKAFQHSLTNAENGFVWKNSNRKGTPDKHEYENC